MNLSEPFIRRPVGTVVAGARIIFEWYRGVSLHAGGGDSARGFSDDHRFGGAAGSGPGHGGVVIGYAVGTAARPDCGRHGNDFRAALGGCNVSIQFDLNRKVDDAAHDVQAAINAAASDLPINLPNPPTYRKVNPADTPIMILALTSDTLPQSDIFEFADSILGQKLSQVEGVSQALISGAEKSAIRVQVNPGALAAANISLEDVRSTLSRVNVNLPLGSFNDDHATHTLAINGQIFEAAQYQQLVLRQTNNTPLRLAAFGAGSGRRGKQPARRLVRRQTRGAGNCFQTGGRERH